MLPTVAFLSMEKRPHSRARFEEEARGLGLRVSWLDPQGFDLLVDVESPRAFYKSRSFVQPAAFVPRTGSDTTMFARAVIRHMERPGGPVIVNSSAAIMAARDKLIAHQMLAEAGIPFPRTVLARQPSDVAKMVRLVGGPQVILKLMSGTHGKGVMLGRDFDEIQASLETVWALNETLLIQEYVECGGTDIRIITIGGRVVGAMKRTAKLGSFRANVHQGAHVEPHPLDEELEWLALRATEVLGLDISGVDVVMGERGYSVIEVNSAPGFEGFEKATGINVAAEILRYVRFRMR
ncbi:MAG: RimK family alpha-L-glutamate ligase [Actinobacteria bacterium]|nr:RimK family alpha-L-glutamate ligase [Actinomycetota bacterium]